MRKYLLYGIIVFQIALIVSLIRGIQISRRSAGRIAALREQKTKLETEKKKLEDEAKYVASPYYLEKVARDELHLSKEGEVVVIVPESSVGIAELGATSEKKDKASEKSNLHRWLEILSGKIQ